MLQKDKGNGSVESMVRAFTEQEQELTISPKINGAESLQESSHYFAGPFGESPPDRKLKV